MGGEGKQAQGRRGQTGDKTQGQDTHVSRPSVTSQAKGHRTTCLFLPQEGHRGSPSHPLMLQARPGAGAPQGSTQAWGTSPPSGSQPSAFRSGRKRDLTFSFSRAPETPRLR